VKITIRGSNPITSDNVKYVLDNLAEEATAQGVVIKNMTLYIRFLNEEGETVDLVDEYGESISRTITFSTVKKVKEPDASDKSNIIDFNKKKKKKTTKKDEKK